MELDYKSEYAIIKSKNNIIQLQYTELLREHATLENSYDELRIKFISLVCVLQ